MIEMVEITKNVFLNSDHIDSMIEMPRTERYAANKSELEESDKSVLTKTIESKINNAQKNGVYYDITGKNGVKSIIIMNNGSVYGTSLLSTTIIKRFNLVVKKPEKKKAQKPVSQNKR